MQMDQMPEAVRAMLSLLRDSGPLRLSSLNEGAVDVAFKMRPRWVAIHTHHPDNPLIDITSVGLRELAAIDRVEQRVVGGRETTDAQPSRRQG